MYMFLQETLTVLSANFFWINFSIVCGQKKGSSEKQFKNHIAKTNCCSTAGLATANLQAYTILILCREPTWYLFL